RTWPYGGALLLDLKRQRLVVATRACLAAGYDGVCAAVLNMTTGRTLATPRVGGRTIAAEAVYEGVGRFLVEAGDMRSNDLAIAVLDAATGAVVGHDGGGRSGNAALAVDTRLHRAVLANEGQPFNEFGGTSDMSILDIVHWRETRIDSVGVGQGE